MHYNDMLMDLAGCVRKLAAFTGIEVSDEKVARVVEATTFANVKKKIAARSDEEDPMAKLFKGGQKRFFFKGTNGRWKDVLTDADLDLYEQAKLRVLEPECAHWLERGDLG